MKNKALTLLLLLGIMTAMAQTPPGRDYVFVKGGKFVMGNDSSNYDERPAHKVKLSDFYVSKTEVTNAQFVKFLNEKGNQRQGNTMWIDLDGKWRTYHNPIYQEDGKFYVKPGYENYPVMFVSWWGAEAYCKWAGGRLPTEAEWEYLARLQFKNNSIAPDTLEKYAVFKQNSGYHPNPVATKQPTKPEIYDLLGNMAEWCFDWYDDTYYSHAKHKNPLGPENGQMKVLRGGSWATPAKSIYPTNRRAAGPDNNNITIGFRVVIPTAKWTDYESNTAKQYGHKSFGELQQNQGHQQKH